MTTKKSLYLRGFPDDLIREAKAFAARESITLTRLVESALRSLVEGKPQSRQLQALEADMAWYETNKSKLLKKYADRYLAIVDSRVVDHDAEFAPLAGRVAERFGNRPVLMPRCRPGERVIRLPSPRLAG
ncbi:MAG: DUF5678 domain-containing protein [Actinomycetota bacterium]